MTYCNILSGWTCNRAVWNKGAHGIVEATRSVEASLPFELLGFDTDNGSEFINSHLYRYCESHRPRLDFTRSRPYETKDNAYIEQKNWTHVRKIFGWARYDTLEAVSAMNDLYEDELRLWHNLFLPSVKMIRKERYGSKVRRVYDQARTPLERVKECPEADAHRVAELGKQMRRLDPFELSRRIDEKLERIYRLTSRRETLRSDVKSVRKTVSASSPWRSGTVGQATRIRKAMEPTTAPAATGKPQSPAPGTRLDPGRKVAGL